MQEPAKYFAIADTYLMSIDSMAEDIVNQDLRSKSPRLGSLTKARNFQHAPTTFLIHMLRDVSQRKATNAFIEDVAFEYRRRRANSEL